MDDFEVKKIGTGLKVTSIIYLLFSVYSIFSTINTYNRRDQLKDLDQFIPGYSDSITLTSTTISIVITVLTIICLILILRKNKIGLISFFVLSLGSLAYALISFASFLTGGVLIFVLILCLFFPGLMGIFAYMDREAFGFKKKSESTDSY